MDNQQQNQPSGEFDLGNFFAKVGDFFGSIWSGILLSVANLRRVSIENRMFLILMLVLGIATGAAYNVLIKRNFYESTMILNSTFVNRRTIENAMQKLNQLAGEPGKAGLIKLLHIDDSLARNILSFEAKPYIDENDIIELRILREQLKNSKLELTNPKVIDDVVKRLEIENRHAFEIKVKLYNPHKFKDLEKALVAYLKDNDYVRKRLEITKKIALDRKQKLERESKKLDSLKAVIYDNLRSMAEQSRQGSNNVVLSDRPVTGPMEVYTQDLALYTLKENIDRSLYLEEDFEVVDGFTELDIPASSSLTVVILKSVLIFIGLGYLLIGVRKFNDYLGTLA